MCSDTIKCGKGKTLSHFYFSISNQITTFAETLIYTIMKASELMIGDWVSMRLPNGKYIADDQLMSVDAVKEGRLIVEPIQLTEQILKANGFVWRNFGIEMDFYQYAFPDECNISRISGFGIGIDDGVFYITDHILMPIRYVHELQHALRLCGLKELADNFKIE